MNFSVLMSVYKNDNPVHFRLALKSVSTLQTIKPKQIVLVLDGPVNQEICKIIEEIDNAEKDIEFTVLKKVKNQGLASALNDGIELCKYDYIARMDADDIAMSNRFELQTKIFENKKTIDILGGYIVEFENNPTITGAIRTVGITHQQIIKMAKHRTPFNHMTVMYKKTKVKEAGGYDVSFGKLEDYKLWVDMIANGCICENIPKVLIKMRVGNGLIKRRSNPREIYDWDRLQRYLLEINLINKIEAFENKIYIRIFTYMPICIKKILYKLFLRDKVKK